MVYSKGFFLSYSKLVKDFFCAMSLGTHEKSCVLQILENYPFTVLVIKRNYTNYVYALIRWIEYFLNSFGKCQLENKTKKSYPKGDKNKLVNFLYIYMLQHL